MRLIPINSIKEGSILAKNIYDTDGRILLSKGVVLNESLLNRVKTNNIYSLYVNDEYSSVEIEDVIKPQLRQKAIKTVKENFNNLIYETTSGNRNKTKVKNNSSYISELKNVVDEIIDDILYKKDLAINLVDIKSMDNYTYEHCVNVTILSLILGASINLSRDKLYDLAVGAMLHDLGKVLIPKEILFKNEELTEAEYSLVKEHSLKGYEYLKDNLDVSGISRMIVLQHHERIDGTGYPFGIQEKEINDLAKIVSVVDVYDALTSDRPYRMAVSPNEAIEYLMGSAGRHFDYNLVKSFVDKIVPYPEGTLVRLSNGDVGVVEELNDGYPLRPKVKVIRQKNITIEIIFIDLLKEKNIVIEGIQYDIPNPSVPNYLKNK